MNDPGADTDATCAEGGAPRAARLRHLSEGLLLAALATAGSHVVSDQVADHWIPDSWIKAAGSYNVWSGVMCAFALLLVASNPAHYGLRIGNIREHWRPVLLVMGIPVLLTWIVYPRLAVRPFSGLPMGMWAMGAWAQDLLFPGFIYAVMRDRLRGFVHPRVKIEWAVVLTAVFFSAWHLSNLRFVAPSYVAFQLCYTFVGGVWTGMTRQWTGSILYVMLTHMAVNYIAVVY